VDGWIFYLYVLPALIGLGSLIGVALITRRNKHRHHPAGE
jgi:ABC-type multidrug transport system permease subunit